MSPLLLQLDQPVTIQFVPEQLITWLIIGLIAGFAAMILVRGRGMNAMSSMVVGLVGAVVGGFLFTILGLQIPGWLAGGFTLRYIDIIVAFIGAVIVLVLVGWFWGRRGG
jgi:uncharacterized membrane protein YeaQ/YmgE (transglycosylase-associated protein family)